MLLPGAEHVNLAFITSTAGTGNATLDTCVLRNLFRLVLDCLRVVEHPYNVFALVTATHALVLRGVVGALTHALFI